MTNAEVDLLGDVGRFLDVEARDELAARGRSGASTSFLPSMASAARSISVSVEHTLMPPALPRAPEWICALTTHLLPPISVAR